MAEFDLLKVKVINQFFSIIEKALPLTKRHRLRYCASKSVQPFRLYPCLRAKFKKNKNKKEKEKSTNPYMLGMCTSVPENFSETKFC